MEETKLGWTRNVSVNSYLRNFDEESVLAITDEKRNYKNPKIPNGLATTLSKMLEENENWAYHLLQIDCSFTILLTCFLFQ